MKRPPVAHRKKLASYRVVLVTISTPALQIVETARKTEIDQRIEEIQSGNVQGIPGDEVSDQVAKVAGRCETAHFSSRRERGIYLSSAI